MHKIGLAEDSICPHYTLNVDERVQNFLLECPSNASYRGNLKSALSRYGIVRATSEMLLGYSNKKIEVKKVERFHVSSYKGWNHPSWILFIFSIHVVLFKIIIQFKFELIWMNSYGNMEFLLQAVLHIFKPARNPFIIILR